MVTVARYDAVDSHTEGMPTRVIVGGIGELPGDTMLERKLRLEREHDEIRQVLMNEPRGHGAMSGAILQPPCREDADWGVVFVEVSGYLPMCGHGAIGVVTVLVETGRVPVTEPETIVRLDVPAGLVEARVQVADGKATSVTIRNVPAFVHELDGEANGIPYDMAFGGNFYAIADAAAVGLKVAPENAPELIAAGLELMAAVPEPVHPETRPSAAATTSSGPTSPAPAPMAARPPRSTRAGWTAPRAGRAPAPAWPSAMPAAGSSWATRSCTSRSSAPASRAGWWGRPRSAAGPR